MKLNYIKIRCYDNLKLKIFFTKVILQKYLKEFITLFEKETKPFQINSNFEALFMKFSNIGFYNIII